MLKKINDILAGIPATIIAGAALILSLALPKFNANPPLDPAWLAVIICGIPLLYLSIWRIIHNPGISKISSALLITIAMVAAIIIGDLFAAGEVGFIMSIGAILEDMTTNRAKKGLHNLISLSPAEGRLVANGTTKMIPIEEVKAGQILRVLPGETIPVDGEIISGATSVDQSIMTGESLPVDKSVGDNLFCGTINCFGTVDMRATNVGADSSLQKLIRMISDAENKQAPMQRMADKAASFLVPVALLMAIIGFAVTKDIVRAVTVLVVFCPCALVLATPTAIMAAIGQATKHGVIIKSGEALEKMGRVDTICFDKTGTLTKGCLVVSDVISFDKNYSQDNILQITAAAEQGSEHPLGKAIVAHALEKDFALDNANDFHMEPGKGISGTLSGKKIICGTESYLKGLGIAILADVNEALEALRNQGKATVVVACDSACIGAIALTDELRTDAATVVSRLFKMGTEAVLLTGDNNRAATHFANQVGIANVHGELLPSDKVSAIQNLKDEGHTVSMIGDGVNDAPALKTAHVGIAMASLGSDIAVESADIALMSDDISKLPYLKRLSNATVKTIRLSIGLSLVINAVAIVLSLLGKLTPTTGALWHNCGSCLVVLIAALLYDRKFEE